VVLWLLIAAIIPAAVMVASLLLAERSKPDSRPVATTPAETDAAAAAFELALAVMDEHNLSATDCVRFVLSRVAGRVLTLAEIESKAGRERVAGLALSVISRLQISRPNPDRFKRHLAEVATGYPETFAGRLASESLTTPDDAGLPFTIRRKLDAEYDRTHPD
jgi:hypothetical protein